MANDKNDPKKPASTAAPRSKRPTTIDLKATEIKPEPVPKAESPEAAEGPSPPPGESAAETPPNPGSAASPRFYMSDAYNKLPDWPWPVIGIAAAAAIVFFAVGLGAGHWLSDRAPQAATAPAPVQSAPGPELTARLAKLEAAMAAPRQDDPQLLARIAAAEAAVKTATEIAASRERRNDDVAAMARDARDRASTAASAAEAAQKSRAASPDSRADIDALTNRMTALEQAARSNQAEFVRRATDSSDDVKSRLAIAAMALGHAVESGGPFTAELSAAKSLSANAKAISALEPFAASGVPTAAALGRELSGLMPSIWKAARMHDPQHGTFLERLQSNAEKIVRIRPAGETAGDEPANVKARIETRAGNADIRGALAELAKLPPEARAPAEGWVRKAEARNAAIAAVRTLSQNALAALAKPGS